MGEGEHRRHKAIDKGLGAYSAVFFRITLFLYGYFRFEDVAAENNF